MFHFYYQYWMIHFLKYFYRKKLRVLDSFGTDARHNDGRYNKDRGLPDSDWGHTELDLRQFYTFYRKLEKYVYFIS